MRPLSIAWRIRLLVTLVVFAVVTVVALTAYDRFRRAYLGHIDRMLEVMANGVGVATDSRAGRDLTADLRRVTTSPWRGTGTHFRVWIAGEPQDLASSVPAGAAQAPFLWELANTAPPSVGEPLLLDFADKKKRYRAIWLRHDLPQGIENVVIAHPTGFEHRRLRELLAVLLWSAGAMVLLGATLGTRLVLLALRPLEATTERIARIREDNLDRRALEGTPVPAELRPVVHEVGELLERLGRALEQQRRLVADASHQLRTPLTLVKSTLAVARARDGDAASYRTAVDEAIEDIDRVQRLIQQLLILARIEQDPGAVTPVELCLDALLEELAVQYDRSAAPGDSGRVVCERLAPCDVRGDEQMLRWLFGNLLDNALHYGPPTGTVRVALEYGPPGSCTAAVQDEGGGMAAEALDRCFDRFYRAEASRNRHPGGAGLGLAIVREVARWHGGEAWATSSPGTRTTFHVRLPGRQR